MKRILQILALLTVGLSGYAQNNYKFDNLPAAVYYDADKPISQGDEGEIVVVVVHGWHGGTSHYMKVIPVMAEKYPGTYCIFPWFPTPQTMKEANKELDGRALWNTKRGVSLDDPWPPEEDWRGGGDAHGLKMSSFDVIDNIFKTLSNKKLYPNLRKVVLTGFSAGGQFVDRYVAVGKGKVRKGVTLEYVSMSPSTDLYYEDDLSWHYGLANRPRYSKCTKKKQMLKNLESRHVLRACGEKDTGTENLDGSKEAKRHGENRFDRFLKYQEYVKQNPKWTAMTQFVTIPGIAHESGQAYACQEVVDFILK